MVDYTRLAATAKRLVEANGRQVTLVKRDSGEGVSGKPWRGPGALPDDTQTPKAVFVGPGAALGTGFEDLVGDVVKSGRSYALVAQDSLPGVDVSGYGFLDGQRVAKAHVLKPGSVVVLYALELEG